MGDAIRRRGARRRNQAGAADRLARVVPQERSSGGDLVVPAGREGSWSRPAARRRGVAGRLAVRCPAAALRARRLPPERARHLHCRACRLRPSVPSTRRRRCRAGSEHTPCANRAEGCGRCPRAPGSGSLLVARRDTAAVAQPTPVRQHYNITLAVLIVGGIAFALQQTMIVPALPILQREFNTSPAWAAWVLTGFLLSASVATPLVGKLGDPYGKERMLVISLSLFLAGSVGAIFAWHIGALIGFRILQGTGAAVFPLSFSIIKDEFPPQKVGTAIGAVSAVFGVGGGLGLSLSGVLIDHLGWRWLFIVGASVVATAVVLVHVFVPESPIKTPSRVDVPGALLLSTGLLSLLVALTEGEHWGWTSLRIVGLFAAALSALVTWALVELRVPEPMV